MSEKPILMTPGNTKAIDEGRKGMTRRQSGLAVINEDPNRWRLDSFTDGVARFVDKKDGTVIDIKAPHAVGDSLYIKEPHYRYGKWVKNGLTKKVKKQAWKFKAFLGGEDIEGQRDGFKFLDEYTPARRPADFRGVGWYKRSPRFMPKKFARKWLKVTAVRVERLQDITRSDIRAEGLVCPPELDSDDLQYNYKNWYVDNWIALWDSINAKRGVCQTCKGYQQVTAWVGSLRDHSLMQTAKDCPDCSGPTGYGWELNPWVWVVTFEKFKYVD